MASILYYEEFKSKYQKIINDVVPIPIVASTIAPATVQQVVLDADATWFRGTNIGDVAVAFDFVESGDIFNKDIAASFRKNILTEGGTDEGMVQYDKFRGKEPTIDALLKKRGFN